MKVSVADAKNKLPELIKAVENGENNDHLPASCPRRGHHPDKKAESQEAEARDTERQNSDSRYRLVETHVGRRSRRLCRRARLGAVAPGHGQKGF